jgi:hypothetical protein
MTARTVQDNLVQRRAEFLANAFLLVLSLGLIGYSVAQWWRSANQPDVAVAGPAPGLRMLMPAVQNSDQQTMLVVLSTQCQPCTDALPLLASVAAQAKDSQGRLRVLTIFAEGQLAGLQYLQKQKIPNVSVLEEKSSFYGFIEHPTFARVDPNGVLRDMWSGRLDVEKQSALLATFGLR